MTQPKPWWALVGGLVLMLTLLASAKGLTKNRIAQTEKNQFRETLEELISNARTDKSYDNDPLKDVINVTSPLLGGTKPHQIFRLRQNDTPTAVLIESITSEGYNGDIETLIAIAAESGELLGVRVTKHRETPGLGDDIEIKRSKWITQFDGHSLSNTSKGQWMVIKDGGEFDQLTGATITARALVYNVERTLLWYAKHKQYVISAETGAHLK